MGLAGQTTVCRRTLSFLQCCFLSNTAHTVALIHTAKSLIVTFNTCMCLTKINCLACIKYEHGSFPEDNDRQYLSDFVKDIY